jgi:hypothetical protein
MKGRQRQKRGSVEFFKLVKEAEKELERIEMFWAAGIVKRRDEIQYYSEVEPYCSDDFLRRLKPSASCFNEAAYPN